MIWIDRSNKVYQYIVKIGLGVKVYEPFYLSVCQKNHGSYWNAVFAANQIVF